MRYLIEYETQRHFRAPVTEHQCQLKIAPYPTQCQAVDEVDIEIEPHAVPVQFVDCFGNQVHHFGVVHPHERVLVRCRSRVRTGLEERCEQDQMTPARERTWIAETLRAKPRLWGYVLHRSPATPDPAGLNMQDPESPRLDPGEPIRHCVGRALEWVESNFEYQEETSHEPRVLAAVLERRAGTSRDLAHLLVTLIRSWGVPARYATGYVDTARRQTCAPLPARAWAEVLMPGVGWRGFDPGRGSPVDDTYVLAAVGRDRMDTEPFRESFRGAPIGGDHTANISIIREA